jgi:hypothetical protein
MPPSKNKRAAWNRPLELRYLTVKLPVDRFFPFEDIVQADANPVSG